MTTKTTILLGAAAGAMMLLGAGGAWAADPANCELNDRQVAAGWTCVGGETITPVTRQIGGPNCQDGTVTTFSYQAINPAGQAPEDKLFESDPDVEPVWGPAYRCPT
jgi:hypothetical protein